jgi:hypothetical protein
MLQLVMLATIHHPGIHEHAPRFPSKELDSKELDLVPRGKLCTLCSDPTCDHLESGTVPLGNPAEAPYLGHSPDTMPFRRQSWSQDGYALERAGWISAVDTF